MTYYHLKRQLVGVGIQRGHQVHSRAVHQAAHSGVVLVVLLAEELHQQQEKLSAHRLVAMETRSVAEFWFTCCQLQCKRMGNGSCRTLKGLCGID